MQRHTQPHPGPDRVKVLVAGTKISAAAMRAEPEPFQQQLQSAKHRFGGGLCLCSDEPMQMVIRERNNKLFLACWPDQAQSHAQDCPFFSAPRDGASVKYTSGAIVDDGVNTNIVLHHPLLQETPSSRATPKPAAPKAVGLSKLHLWGLLHHLWESGGLNRWNPGWSRNWGLVSYMLRRAAQSTMVDNQPLLPNLYVPPVWTQERKAHIRVLWNDFTRPLFQQNRSTAMVASGLLIGVVRKLEITEGGFAISLKNHAEPFYIDAKVADRISTHSRKGWAALRMSQSMASKTPVPMVVAALRVQAKQSKAFVVVEGALMRVSPSFIPVSSSYEEKLAELLVKNDRRFVKPLHYDLQHHDLAHFVLTDCANKNSADTGSQKIALYVYGAAIEATYQRKLEAKNRTEASAMGLGFWKWNVNESSDIPELPLVVTPHQSTTQPTPTSKEKLHD